MVSLGTSGRVKLKRGFYIYFEHTNTQRTIDIFLKVTLLLSDRARFPKVGIVLFFKACTLNFCASGV